MYGTSQRTHRAVWICEGPGSGRRGEQRDQGGSEMVAEPSRGDPSRTRQRLPRPGLEAPSSGFGCLLAQWAEGS